jgi:hypothetical protein
MWEKAAVAYFETRPWNSTVQRVKETTDSVRSTDLDHLSLIISSSAAAREPSNCSWKLATAISSSIALSHDTFRKSWGICWLVEQLLTNSVEYSLWEANSHSSSQDIPRLLRNPNVHYRVHNSPPLIHVHHISLRSVLILSFHLRLGIPSGIFPSGFRPKGLCRLEFIMIQSSYIVTLLAHPPTLRLRAISVLRRTVWWIFTFKRHASLIFAFTYRRNRQHWLPRVYSCHTYWGGPRAER